jgi:hypothetical protein
MTPNEILHEIQKLPLSEQAKIKQTLLENSESAEEANSSITKKEMWQKLYDEGFITHIPVSMTDEEDDFEPIEIEGEPVSETIIQERR